MKKLIKIIEAASDIGAALSSIFFLLITLLILVEVFLRSFFNKSTLICDEYSAYMFVWLVMMGLAYTFKTDGHIRINLILSKIPDKWKKIFEIWALTVAFGILIYSFYHSFYMVLETYRLDMRADTIAETPLYLPEIALPLGYLLFILQLITKLIKNLTKGSYK